MISDDELNAIEKLSMLRSIDQREAIMMLITEMRRLREENERLRAVEQAAREWNDAPDGTEMTATLVNLDDALTALDAWRAEKERG